MDGNAEKASEMEWELKKKKALETPEKGDRMFLGIDPGKDCGVVVPGEKLQELLSKFPKGRFVRYAKSLVDDTPKSGVAWYVHYQSGQIYRIIAESQYHDDARSGTPVVTYQNVVTDQFYTTPYDRFFGQASKFCNVTNQKILVPRFTPIAVPVDLSGCLSTLNAAIRMLDVEGIELPESYRAKVMEAKAQMIEVLEKLKVSG